MSNPYDYSQMFRMFDPEQVQKAFDPNRMFAMFEPAKSPAFDMSGVFEMNRKNFEAMVEANKAAAAAYKDLLEKQMEVFQQMTQAAREQAAWVDEAVVIAERIGYPVLVRPSYVLGGRAMEIVWDERSLRDYFGRAVRASPEHPVLLDRFLEGRLDQLAQHLLAHLAAETVAHDTCRHLARPESVQAHAALEPLEALGNGLVDALGRDLDLDRPL